MTATQQRTKTNYLLGFCRIFTGLLFIFSGFIKANDPTGFGYKLQEYFEVFHLTAFNEYATAMAVVICGFEILLGALLLLGVYANTVAWGLLLLILFFTFLTFYSAFFEVVTSCGCFGDAIPLTPWQSFSKDLVLLALILILFFNRKQLRSIIKGSGNQFVATLITAIISLGIGVYTVNYLPFIDFLPYKVGNNLPSLMVLPEGKQGDVFEQIYTMKNKKTGETKKVNDKVYMADKLWEDESWEIIGEPESRLVKKGYDIPIPDLLITDADGADHTQEIIANPYYNLVIVAKDLSSTNIDAIQKINQTAIQLTKDYNGLRVVLLTASASKDAQYLSDKMQLIAEIFYADLIPLKSMVRANPGVLLLKGGNVLGKWHYNNFPDAKTIEDKFLSKDK
ncbi:MULTISPECIES: BT_3928 family protein [Sphingobacterium]|uniref:DoxX n=1 Tax=Sphingobacterium multivorum TaxID=28454 RepID=A0A654C9G8_SPHMU|nr:MULTISPECIES: BT_3928 family protein [Sphingobacterium]HAE67378.1 DoxX family membrane protein [Sphingobacterium sp.]OFV15834.1 DoxX family protein [Sphingobacterium sp. HMSC13C05]QQT44329.1 DoxX family membrane protein [Sphingobacterium multivorum]SUJ86729.1 DoxX [Sphingobacterium multivorum]VXC89957.1 DoxX [Sphingobacterium multivorum]